MPDYDKEITELLKTNEKLVKEKKELEERYEYEYNKLTKYRQIYNEAKEYIPEAKKKIKEIENNNLYIKQKKREKIRENIKELKKEIIENIDDIIGVVGFIIFITTLILACIN
jgi:uncharacterized coiled-coil DUF342 family protein